MGVNGGGVGYFRQMTNPAEMAPQFRSVQDFDTLRQLQVQIENEFSDSSSDLSEELFRDVDVLSEESEDIINLDFDVHDVYEDSTASPMASRRSPLASPKRLSFDRFSSVNNMNRMPTL